MKTMNKKDRKAFAEALRTLADQVDMGLFDDVELNMKNGIQDIPYDFGRLTEPVLTGEKLIRIMMYNRPKPTFTAQHDPYVSKREE